MREPIDVTWMVGLGTSGAAVLEPVDEDRGKLPWLPAGLPACPPLRWNGGRVTAAGPALLCDGVRGAEEASGDDGTDGADAGDEGADVRICAGGLLRESMGDEEVDVGKNNHGSLLICCEGEVGSTGVIASSDSRGQVEAETWS